MGEAGEPVAGGKDVSTATEYRQLLAKYSPRPIRSQGAYEQALATLEGLIVPRPNEAHSLLIELIATLIEKYESETLTPEVAASEMRQFSALRSRNTMRL